MSEKEPSAASNDLTQSPPIMGTRCPADATPGGPFPPVQPPLVVVLNPSSDSHQYTLQFLIAVIKKPSPLSASTNTEKPQ